MHWLNEIARALQMAAMMGWQMLWALLLGFGLSAVVQATVSRGKVARLMPDGGPRSIGLPPYWVRLPHRALMRQ